MTQRLDILITSYKHPEYLDECLQSLAAQTWQGFNVHIVDDSPGNPVQGVIDKWRAQGMTIEFSQNEQNIGGIECLDAMYQRTQSDYVMWLHHDDILWPQFLEKLLCEGLLKHPECGFGYSLYQRKTGDQIQPDTGVYRPALSTGPHSVVHHLCITNWIICSFAIFKRSALDQVGGIQRHAWRDRLIGLPTSAYPDQYMCARVAAQSPAYVLDEPQGYYRIHASNATNRTGGELRRITESVRTYDYIFDDHNIFDKVTRYLAKANAHGRLLSDVGVIQAMLQMIQATEVGQELRPMAKELLIATHQALSPLIYDDAARGRPLVTPRQHLDEVARLVQQL
ncbi:glycosyltransferase family A protein [Curvibacter sp. HBC61]|uniref:Glycosyltransferase family A protein n=1 Tax=Curvibacter cyanobacteriorum TaxID=3026422 RepID=A0ABT5N1D4_9BURK|nr:glycosyltransferase family A protein [Curvibacter sp. HBC61]MDD0840119.1 glycosyltransferase family A protein [Curvibacter sp. HBC61]